MWLDRVVPLLNAQPMPYFIIISEQAGDNVFNKGKLMNAAAHKAIALNAE